MTAGPFYLGQVPLNPFNLKIVDEAGNPVDVSTYTDVDLLLFDPQNATIDTSAGLVQVDPDRTGVLVYSWPTASLFASVGTYRFQVRLSNASALDFTRAYEFNVLPLGGLS